MPPTVCGGPAQSTWIEICGRCVGDRCRKDNVASLILPDLRRSCKRVAARTVPGAESLLMAGDSARCGMAGSGPVWWRLPGPHRPHVQWGFQESGGAAVIGGDGMGGVRVCARVTPDQPGGHNRSCGNFPPLTPPSAIICLAGLCSLGLSKAQASTVSSIRRGRQAHNPASATEQSPTDIQRPNAARKPAPRNKDRSAETKPSIPPVRTTIRAILASLISTITGFFPNGAEIWLLWGNGGANAGF